MTSYKDAKIYRICSDLIPDVYIGSTTQELKQRLKGHEQDYKMYTKHRKGNYTSSFKILSTGSYSISLIERYPCESRQELLMREGYYIKNTMNCINNNVNNTDAKEDAKEHYGEYLNVKELLEHDLIITDDDDDRIGKSKMMELYNNRFHKKIQPLKLIQLMKESGVKYGAKLRCNGVKGCFIGITIKEDEPDDDDDE